jgi:hypothetical protein
MAVDHFTNLLAPPKKAGAVSDVQAVSKPTQVVGDADGSICRMVLAGINAGYMTLPDEQLNELAGVMKEEAIASVAYNRGKNDVLEKFQKNPDIAAKFDRIISNATFQQGHSKIVFLGDILHDRFSNNKQAMDKLIRGLHNGGAVFITGNHDVYGEVNPTDELQLSEEDLVKKCEDEAIAAGEENTAELQSGIHLYVQENAKFKLQNGFYGAKQLTKTESDQLLMDCFVNAHLDQESLMLYTHNGFQRAGVDGYYLTAFGILRRQCRGVGQKTQPV